ncbi:MAG: cell surface protein [Subtercola sp.]|nr:cell surface protein [Subtercola sp.]
MRRSPFIAVPACALFLAATVFGASGAMAVPVTHDPLVQLAAGTGPTGISAAAGGHYWVTYRDKNQVALFDGAASAPSAVLPTGAKPIAVATDSIGGVWIDDVISRGVTHYDSDGSNGVTGNLGANSPIAIAVDPSLNAYTVSPTTHLVSKLTYDSTLHSLFAIQAFADVGPNTSPVALDTDPAGNIYTANYGTSTISEVTPTTATSGTASVITTLDPGAGPDALAIDSLGFLYVANFGSSTVTKINTAAAPNANVVGTFTLPPGATPTSLAIDSLDNVYVVNAGANSVSEIPAGSTGTPLTIKQYPAGAALASVAVTSTHTLVVTSADNNSVSSIDLTPVITTTSVADGTVGAAYSSSVAGTGVDDLTFDLANAPTWLHIDGATGALTGIPTDAGTVTFSVIIGSPAGPGVAKQFTFTVAAANTGGSGGGGSTGGTGGTGGAGGGSGSAANGGSGSGAGGSSTLAHTGASASTAVAMGGAAGLVLLVGLVITALRRKFIRSSN